MIAQETQFALDSARMRSTPAAVATPSPVAFLVKSAMYFRGEPIDAGASIDATLTEAIGLFGNWHVELKSQDDAPRILDASRAGCKDHQHMLKRSQPGFVGRYNT